MEEQRESEMNVFSCRVPFFFIRGSENRLVRPARGNNIKTSFASEKKSCIKFHNRNSILCH